MLSVIDLTGQEGQFKAPDYEGIRSVMNKKASEFYYPKLMERYQQSDTTLTLQDFRILYYGVLYTDGYSPYGQSDYADSLRSIFNKDTLLISDFRLIIQYENSVLREYPFNLRDMNALSFAYYKTGDSISMNNTNFKMNRIITTILSTGDGKKEKSAWHVVSVGHEYDLLGVLGFQFGGSQSLTNKRCDYLTVQKNEYNIEGFYFDVNKILDKESELFKN